MTPLEIEQCLDSMTICVDTREQESARAVKRYQMFGCPWERRTLDYGDYTYNFTLPNGCRLFSDDMTIKGDAVIERKMSLMELSGNFTRSRKRFTEEFERARAAGSSVYILVEDATWEKIIAGHYKTKFRPEAYIASMTAWMARYNAKPIFCRQETSGRLIKEILYRELKERLECGKYG